MPPDRPERSRDGRDSPYYRQQDDPRRRERSRSRSRERDRERSYDRRSPPPRRRSPSRERDDRQPRRRSRSRSPPSRDERDRRLSPRNEGKSRASSRSRSPPKRRPTSPMNDSQRYRRDYPSGPTPRQGNDSQQGGYEYGASMRGRGGWRGSSYPYPSRGYQPRQYDALHMRDQPDTRGSLSTPYNSQYSSQTTDSSNLPTSASTSQGPSDPSTPAAPSGPASWRRAQQFRQDSRPPYQQDYRSGFLTPRGGPPVNPVHRNAPRTPFSHPPQSPLEKSPHESISTSPTLNRPIPTGPRASSGSLAPVQQPTPVKKEYISPIADLDQNLAKLKSDYERLEAKDWEIQKRKRAALAEWTLLDRESKREAVKVDMVEKLLEATVNGTVFVT